MSGRKLRVVIDSNQFVSGLLNRHGQPFALITAFRNHRFTLVISDEQRKELQDVLSRPRLINRYHLSVTEAEALLTLIDRRAMRVAPSDLLPVSVRDAKDEIILASSLAGAADYLVTGDDDLLVLNGDPALGSLRIVTVREFLSALEQQEADL